MAFGAVVARVSAPHKIPEHALGKKIVVQGRIVDEWHTASTTYYILRANAFQSADTCNAVACDFRIQLTVPGNNDALQVGDIVAVKTKIKPAYGPLGVPGQSDNRLRLYADGISATASIFYDSYKVLGHHPTFTQRIENQLSTSLEHTINNAGFNNETTQFVQAVIAGDSSYLPEELQTNFRAAGLAHVLALSGMHVSILVACAMWLFWWVRFFSIGRWIYYSLPILFVWIYALTTGLGPSVCRASVMVTVFMLTRLVQGRPNGYNALCVTLLVILLAKPFWIFSIGLQLSSIAVLSLIWLGNLLDSKNLSHKRLKMLLFLFSPVVAGFSTMALCAFYFNQVPLWFLPANLLAAIFIGPLLILAVITLTVTWIGLPSLIFAWATDCVFYIINGISSFFANLPGALISDVYITPFDLLLWGVVAGFIVMAAHTGKALRRRIFLSCAGFAILAICLVHNFATGGDNQTEVYFTNDPVCQRIVVFAENQAVVIGLGTRPEVESMLQFAQRDYRVPCLQRGITPSIMQAPECFTIGKVSRTGDLLHVGKRTIYFCHQSSDSLPERNHTDYALVVGGYHGSIDSLVRRLSPDIILLGVNMHPSTRKKVIPQLLTGRIPYHDLRECPMVIK